MQKYIIAGEVRKINSFFRFFAKNFAFGERLCEKGAVFTAIRTDLALEAKALWEKSAGETTELSGVKARERESEGLSVTQVDILDEQGQAALGKPIGRYVTVELPRFDRDRTRPARVLAQELRALLHGDEEKSVLVVGLGNRAVTPDALGPRTTDGLFLTRHLIANLPAQFGACREVSAVAPGVLATTGVETLELVRGAVSHVKPELVIAVDALAAGSMERLCRTVQLSDTGIVPGSGVGNRRAGFSEETLGVPVFSVGVPTVVDASALCESAEERMIVTPRDIDAKVAWLGSLLADALNAALHPKFSQEELAQFVQQ